MTGRTTRSRRPGLVLLLALALVLFLTPNVGAQDTEVDQPVGGPVSEDPEPATAEPPAINFDISEVITVDEDGNLVFNLPTETTDAVDITAEPTTIPSADLSGTGTEGGAGSGSTGTADSSDAEGGSSVQSGSGNGLALIFAVVGLIAVAAVGGVFVVRVRKQKNEELDVVEDVMDPLANEKLAGEFTEPEYAGAGEAGAYEEGGAAYAQYADPEYAAANGGTDAAASTKFNQLRASVVDLADRGLADSGHDRLVAKKLEAAGSQMRPGEWLVLAVAGTVAAFATLTFFLGWVLGAFAAVLTGAGFWMYLSFKESSRQKAFAETLPETLQLISGSLRGGLSLMQAIQTVADEADSPTSEEFQRIVTETRLGRDLALSFRDLSTRMASKDFEWVVTAIEIHREVGGDLAGILDRVGDTIRARNRVRGQVKALSAEGKMSGMILFILPPGMVLAISVLNREYLNEMLDTEEGQIMLVVSGVLLLAGGFWLKRLSRFIY
ncbi:MAG: type II secretion system F family protein [Acidimicrobiales bacterium]